jgi:PPOX class probable F420-dependent enzyme
MNRSTPLDDAQYVSLRSYRRNGSAVDTPVWVAPLDGKLVIFTLDDSYKVGRIARNPIVQLARCDARGGNVGDWRSGRCVSLTRGTAEEARAYEAFNRKYGLIMRLGTLFSTLVGRVRKRLVLEVTLEG